jgi:hypothetical protein
MKGTWKIGWAVALGAGMLLMSAPAAAQQGGRIELEVIEIESEVPRRVAQFFVQRDRLHYQPVDDQPSFLEDLLKSVEDEPF